MKTIYLLIGCPGIGKSWVADQISNKFKHLHPDAYLNAEKKLEKKKLLNDIVYYTNMNHARVLVEIPFSISEYKDPLEKEGFKVECVFILEDEDTIKKRYFDREGKEIPKGHLTRQKTFEQRSVDYNAFAGTSQEVLDYLKSK